MKKEQSLQKVMMFSSVHTFKDARILFKEAYTLCEKYAVDFYAIGNVGEVKAYEKKGLKIHLLAKKSRLKRFLTILEIKKAIKASDAKYFHFHDPELLTLVPFIRKMKPDGIIIYDMHENFPEAVKSKNWLPKSIRKPLAKSIQKIEKRLMRNLDGIIFAEESYKKYYEHVKADKIDIYNYPTHMAKNIDNKSAKPLTMIYIGRIAKVRGIFEMLELVKMFQEEGTEIKLQLIGLADNDLLQEMQAFIQGNRLEKMVEYSSYIEYSKIKEYYSKADIGLCLLHPIPNYLESLATKIFEYMAMSLPMVVSDFPAWKKVITENDCGLVVNPLNIIEVKNAIQRLMEDNCKRKELGANGRKNYIKKYNWDIEGEKLVQFYRKLSNEV
ncbi:glycosyltransferase [Paenilisteria rocourtiae]|uniref:Glycosyltransferase involved in cell wall biosynthesis n=1 Tax=Listeria rocourtiae TaxID=647910 RepID=A0A4R6ZKV1_9LIST|nr:glycosyltransferase [Listeria rocourtiae]EUJ51011.1 putative capsular polysaccharide synthesis enzyme [Listeria rocourtiae FSL F6-920]MBC1435280.1 glycosyltransferase family 4 protein [Listeria rocourtiae]MBC1604324.1 glycosyltransferase family 4 protein [Listeria rocourtiae]TDR52882.1 glycosyltransferase involved in cell wall biosynthesis [Listeria rocourtiae]